jgi:Protein of unknown function (DUF2752)
VHTDTRIAVDTRLLRYAGGAMLAVAAVKPMFAGDTTGVPCPLRSLTGIPCPLCGMTRGVTALVHGDVARAALLNPGSVLLVLAAVALIVLWRVPRVTIPSYTIPLVVAALWTFELVKYGTGLPL